MPFDIASLKDKLDAQQFTDLSAFVTEQATRTETAEGKARTAARESIEGRTKLKADLQLALEKLGVDSADALSALPDSKGQADALKQYEVQLKRAQRERDEFKTSLDDVQGKVTASRREAAIAQALASQPFLDKDLASDFISARIRQEGDDFLMDAGGKLVSVQDGAAWLATTKPILLPPAGNGATGSGFKGNPSGQGYSGNTGEAVIDTAAIYASRAPQAIAAVK